MPDLVRRLANRQGCRVHGPRRAAMCKLASLSGRPGRKGCARPFATRPRQRTHNARGDAELEKSGVKRGSPQKCWGTCLGILMQLSAMMAGASGLCARPCSGANRRNGRNPGKSGGGGESPFSEAGVRNMRGAGRRGKQGGSPWWPANRCESSCPLTPESWGGVHPTPKTSGCAHNLDCARLRDQAALPRTSTEAVRPKCPTHESGRGVERGARGPPLQNVPEYPKHDGALDPSMPDVAQTSAGQRVRKPSCGARRTRRCADMLAPW